MLLFVVKSWAPETFSCWIVRFLACLEGRLRLRREWSYWPFQGAKLLFSLSYYKFHLWKEGGGVGLPSSQSLRVSGGPGRLVSILGLVWSCFCQGVFLLLPSLLQGCISFDFWGLPKKSLLCAFSHPGQDVFVLRPRVSGLSVFLWDGSYFFSVISQWSR